MTGNSFPRRIVALSGESADFLQRIGAWSRVCGVTAYYNRPASVQPKPIVSGFSSGSLEKITALKPDLVITYSDVQADLAAQLLRAGLPVLATNQRTLAQIEETLLLIGRVVGLERAAANELQKLKAQLTPTTSSPIRPKIYFEEWPDPMTTPIAWVSELIERAGGIDIFVHKRTNHSAKDRSVTSEEVISSRPDIILASWCGKPVKIQEIVKRPGWSDLPAIRNDQVHEIPSSEILQPGMSLLDGFKRIRHLVSCFIQQQNMAFNT